VSKVRWLIILARDQKDLFTGLQRRFEGRALVVLDRRHEDRRRHDVPVAVERRVMQRRQPLTLPEEALWKDGGYRMLFRPEYFEVFVAEDGSTAWR
jgi:hypothetical protein